VTVAVVQYLVPHIEGHDNLQSTVGLIAHNFPPTQHSILNCQLIPLREITFCFCTQLGYLRTGWFWPTRQQPLKQLFNNRVILLRHPDLIQSPLDNGVNRGGIYLPNRSHHGVMRTAVRTPFVSTTPHRYPTQAISVYMLHPRSVLNFVVRNPKLGKMSKPPANHPLSIPKI
jgi:hypothetical protein